MNLTTEEKAIGFETVSDSYTLTVSDIPVFDLRSSNLTLVLKRVIDLLGASVLLILLAPLLFIVAALVKMSSPGPVFFRQKRLGLYVEPFRMWKFRTMVPQAQSQEESLRRSQGNVFFKIKNDPRITPMGRFLRRYSLDELPQLINVLTGEMSLVGPRPLLPFEIQRFSRREPFLRFMMKPGLTCIWQVSGRSRTSDADRIRYDLEYVSHWSLVLDFKLLFKTIPAVLKGDGAV